MTTIELAREVGSKNNILKELIEIALDRYIKAGHRAFILEEIPHAYNNRQRATHYVLTPQIMQALHSYFSPKNQIRDRIYEVHPEWMPTSSTDADIPQPRRPKDPRAKEYNRRAREREAAYRHALEGTTNETQLTKAHLYSFLRAARTLGFPDTDAFRAALLGAHIIRRGDCVWELTADYAGHGYTEQVTVTVGKRRGCPTPFPATVWTERGMAFLQQLIKKKKLKTTPL